MSTSFPTLCDKFARKLQRVPPKVTNAIHTAQGIIFLRTYKLGCIITARGANGAVVIRREDGSWANPAAVGMGGMAIGADIGVESSSIIIVCQSRYAIENVLSSARSGGGTLSLGLHGSLTIGKFGKSAEVLILEEEECLTYTFGHKGLYGGLSFEFTGISLQRQRNREAYASHFSQTSDCTLEEFADLEWTDQPEFTGALHTALDDQACKNGSQIAGNSDSKSNGGDTRREWGCNEVVVDFAEPAAPALADAGADQH